MSRRLRLRQERRTKLSIMAILKAVGAITLVAASLLALEHHRSAQLQRKRAQDQHDPHFGPPHAGPAHRVVAQSG